jgi:hypothetical protein
MLLARKQVRAQLRQTPGLIRWADAVASRTEFFTLTVWESKHLMFEFMSGDAHREMMWQFAQISDEFWSMRWTPTEQEIGTWDNLQLGCREVIHKPQTPVPHLARPPRTSGGIIDPSTCPVTAITARVQTRDLKKARALVRTRESVQGQGSGGGPELLRWTIASVQSNRHLILMFCKNEKGQLLKEFGSLLPEAWIMRWEPGDYEIGHWSGLRLRHVAPSVGQRQPTADKVWS